MQRRPHVHQRSHTTTRSGEARTQETPEAIRQIDALDSLAHKAGTVLSVDRDELLGLLHAAECAGAGR